MEKVLPVPEGSWSLQRMDLSGSPFPNLGQLRGGRALTFPGGEGPGHAFGGKRVGTGCLNYPREVPQLLPEAAVAKPGLTQVLGAIPCLCGTEGGQSPPASRLTWHGTNTLAGLCLVQMQVSPPPQHHSGSLGVLPAPAAGPCKSRAADVDFYF